MSKGMSRRDLIKASAIAGAAAWTAPVLLSSPAGAQTTTTCAGIKIPSCSAANSGKVALCDGFETDNPADFSACVAQDCTKYHPSFGTFLKVCGPVATNGTVAVKWAGNAQGCTPATFNASGCVTGTFSGPGAGTSGPFSGCTTGTPTSGNAIEWSAINGSYTNVAAGISVGAAGAGNRWVFIKPPGNVNEIGIAVCFTFGSVPPTCASGSCTA
jgi:hypothetical protein